MEASYREFDPERDGEAERELFRLSFPETVGTAMDTPAHHVWKFEAFPDAVHSYQYVAAKDRGLVGYYAAIPYTYLINGKHYRCGMVCDVMTHPESRGQGIFTRIGHFATGAMKEEGLAFTTGYPIRPEVIPGHVKVGWKIVVRLPMYLRLIGSRSFLPAPLRPFAYILNPMVNLAQCWSWLMPRGYSVETLSRAEFLERHAEGVAGEFNSFLEHWIAGQPNALLKSIPFLAWRTGAPGTDYRFLLLRCAGELVGMAIARPTVLKGVETLATIDFMVLSTHLRGCRALHLELRRLARSLGKDAVACMLSARWAKAYRFFGSAYLRSPAVFSLIVKKLDDSLADAAIYDGDRWHLCWLDSDDL